MQNSQLRSVEIFAGAAGLGLGLAAAGFKHEIVVENDHDACETIRLNQSRNHPLVEGWDIREASIEDCDLSEIRGEIDLVSGGPPCQGFSIGGKHRGAQDERNLWPWAIQTVAALKPKAFLFENVPNLASAHRDYLEYLEKALALPTIAQPHQWPDDKERMAKILADRQSVDPSYDVTVEMHVAADFGTGQKRRRLFISGIRKDLGVAYSSPAPTHSYDELMARKWITGQYWDEHALARPTPDDEAMRWIRQHNRRTPDLFSMPLKPWQTVRDVISRIPADAENHELAPREAKAYPGHTGSPIDAPAKTHRAGDHGVSGGEMMIDYGAEADTQGRYRHYTVREAAALSDFPDNYVFHGSWGDALRQIGNAVPCKLAQAMGKSIAKAIG